MRIPKQVWLAALPSLLLIALSTLPILRDTAFVYLAIPVSPLIHWLGLLYADKPWFLTPEAAILTACVWAVPLSLLCVFLNRIRL